MSAIMVVVPVLGRAKAIRPLIESLRASSSESWYLLFLCSPGDATVEECESHTRDEKNMQTWIVTWTPEVGGDWARKINYAATQTYVGEDGFYLLGATDLRFHPGWDRAALRVAEETGVGVIGTNDLGNATVMRGHHSTHPLVRGDYAREWGTIDEKGKILHEGYLHQWVDTELCETAMARGQWAFAADSRVEHLHPFWHKGEMDDTYKKALSTTHEDHRLYGKRRRLWRQRSPLLHDLDYQREGVVELPVDPERSISWPLRPSVG
jgi:hypothetical protein